MKKTLFSVIPAQRNTMTDKAILDALYNNLGTVEANAIGLATTLSREHGTPFMVIQMLSETSISIRTEQFAPAILSEGSTLEMNSFSSPMPYHIFHVIGGQSFGFSDLSQSRQFAGTVYAINHEEAFLKSQNGNYTERKTSMLIPQNRITTTGDLILCPTGVALLVTCLSPLTFQDATAYFRQVHGFGGGDNSGSGSGSGSGTSTGTNTGSQQWSSNQPQGGGNWNPQGSYQPGSSYQPSSYPQGSQFGPQGNFGSGNGSNQPYGSSSQYGSGYGGNGSTEPEYQYSVRITATPSGKVYEIIRTCTFNPDPSNTEWSREIAYTPFQIIGGKFRRTGQGWLFYKEGQPVSSAIVTSLNKGIVPQQFIETLPEGGFCVYVSHLSQVPADQEAVS